MAENKYVDYYNSTSMDIYAENILDHYRHPRHKEALVAPSISHTETNPACGDTLTLALQMDNGTISALGWSGSGCAISQAGMSLVSEELVGKSVEELLAWQKSDVDAFLGVPVGPRRIKCELLSLHTLKNALRKYQQKELQSWRETIGEE